MEPNLNQCKPKLQMIPNLAIVQNIYEVSNPSKQVYVSIPGALKLTALVRSSINSFIFSYLSVLLIRISTSRGAAPLDCIATY